VPQPVLGGRGRLALELAGRRARAQALGLGGAALGRGERGGGDRGLVDGEPAGDVGAQAARRRGAARRQRGLDGLVVAAVVVANGVVGGGGGGGGGVGRGGGLCGFGEGELRVIRARRAASRRERRDGTAF
jgi:hypothetical protein